MAFYNELFIEENNELKHVASCTGSDTPCYFDEVKSKKDWDEALNKLSKDQGFFSWHKEGSHPFPWSSYKTSDWLIVLRKKKGFLINKYEVLISIEKRFEDEPLKVAFVPIKNFFGDEDEEEGQVYAEKVKVFLKIPVLKK